MLHGSQDNLLVQCSMDMTLLVVQVMNTTVPPSILGRGNDYVEQCKTEMDTHYIASKELDTILNHVLSIDNPVCNRYN